MIRTEDQTDVLYITYINRMTSNQKENKNSVASKRDTMRKEQFPARKTEGSPRKRISRVCLQYSTLSPQKNRKFGRGNVKNKRMRTAKLQKGVEKEKQPYNIAFAVLFRDQNF